MSFTGSCNALIFNDWIANQLVPKLKKGQKIIMDNASFHKKPATRALIEKAKCELIYLPAYSPDLNPIEKFWANVKRIITNTAHLFETFQDAIESAFIRYNSILTTLI